MNSLPSELLYSIFIDMNINELIILYKTTISIQRLLNSKEMLNLLYRQYDIKATSFEHFIHLYKQKIFNLLNKLGKIYHAKWEFEWDNEFYVNYDEAVEAFKDHVTTFMEEGDLITSVDELKPDEVYATLPNDFPDQLIKLSNMIIPYKTIIVIQNRKWQSGKPDEYNFPNYLTINTPFIKATISANIKGTDLTIKDVLMAFCAMTPYKYSSVLEDGCTILEDNEMLVIEMN